jgi:hypothetical protein
MRGKWTALALFVAIVAALFVALGLSNSGDPVAAAASATDAGSTQVALTVGVDTPSGETIDVTANGVAAQDQGDLTVDASSALAAAGLPGSGSIEIRYLQENGDPVVYLNAPFLAGMLPGGQSWVRIDVEKAGQALGVDPNQILGQASQNPTSVLDLLQQVGSVETVPGAETINGESTTHYKATIDLTKVASQIGSDAQAFAQHLIDQGAPSSIPIDVWVGSDGLVRQVTFDESAPGGQAGAVHLKVDLTPSSTPVTVTAPPASDTFDATSLAGQLQQLHP